MGENDANRNALSLYLFVEGFKNTSLNSNYIKDFSNVKA